MRKFAIILLSFIALISACRKEPIDSSQTDEGLNLKLNFSLSDFNMGVPTVSKSVVDLESTDIHSCAICIFKMDKATPSKSRIVAYRIFIDDSIDGHKYFFKNHNPAEYLDEDGDSLVDVALSDAGGYHISGIDDTYSASSVYGENGISADKKSVKAEFRFNNPLHGLVEGLRDGEYLVIALANFHEEPIIAIHKTLGYWIKEQIKYWQDHQNDSNFDGIVYDPVYIGGDIAFAGAKQIIDARVRLYDATIQSLESGDNPSSPVYKASHGDVIKSDSYIHSSNTSLCASTSLEIKIKSGDNVFSLDLTRLAARASFFINNYSTQKIVIESFNLSNNFGSAATYLFPVIGTDSEHNSPTWLGQPSTEAPHAIMPFDNSIEYNAGITDNLFFDALLASGYDESGKSPLSFSIRVGIANGDYNEIDLFSYSEFIYNLSSPAWIIGTTKEYFIQTAKEIGSKQLLVKSYEENTPKAINNGKADSQSELDYVYGLVEEEDASSDEYIWLIEKVNNTQYRIKNKSIGKYLKIADFTWHEGKNHNLQYTNDVNQATIFGHNQYIGNHTYPGTTQQTWVKESNREKFKDSFAIVYNKGSGETNEIYLNIVDDNKLVSLNKWADEGSHFHFHPVHKVIACSTYKNIDVPIKVYDKNTDTVTPLHELKRNSHLKVSINVNYNEHTQDIDFSVNGWDSKENIVEFE